MNIVGRVRHRVVTAGAVIALFLVTGAAATGAGAQVPSELPSSPGDPELFNLEHVFTFNPGDHDPDRSPTVGSDLEFFTHTVPLRDYATGALVDEAGNPTAEPVMAERDFAVMGSYQRGGYVFDITDPENTQFVTQVTCRQDRNDVAIRKFTDPVTGEVRVVLALTQQRGTPCGSDDDGGVGVQVNAPPDLAGLYGATQWAGTAEVDGQTAELVYAGTGCTPLAYAGLDLGGKIALVDDNVGQGPLDECPAYTFAQKTAAAEAAGAIGLVQVEADDDVFAGSAVTSSIPALALPNTVGTPIRDAVVEGTPVDVTLTAAPSTVPVLGEGSGGIGVFDITDPYAWSPMYRLLTTPEGVHNFIFHPTKPYGYASNGALPGLINDIPIVDFTDLDNPEVLTGRVPTEGGVHDVEFSPDGDRAYAASENNYRIYDTTDPANPLLLSRTPNVGSYAHGVFPSSDGELMVTNNESLVLGGFFAEGTGVCPGEGLASYDTTDEANPVGPLGYYTPNVVGPTDARPCTSHFGRFAPGTAVLSMGWYIAGTRIVDWSDPRNPVEVAGAVLDGTDTWAAKFHKGPYVYAGDRVRGFDVFRWAGEGPAPWLAGQAGPTAGVQAACVDCPAEIRAGESGTAEIHVSNTGDGHDSYDVGVHGVPEGWTATVEPAQVAVAPGEEAAVTLTVDVPRSARAGTSTLTVTANSVDHDASGSAAVDVAVRKGRPSDAGPPSDGGPASPEQDPLGLAPVAAEHAGGLSAPAVVALVLVLLTGSAALRRLWSARS